MRVTSDCPLIDPEVCGLVLRHRVDAAADYACNNDPPSWPHGLDCEAMTISALSLANSNATELFDREHVTPWIRRNSNFRRINVAGTQISAGLRWTLDHLEDYQFFQAVFDELDGEPTTVEVLRLLAEKPQIAAINAGFSDVLRTRIVSSAAILQSNVGSKG